MATKSKNTNIFKGTISLLCLLVTLVGIAGIIIGLVILAVDPYVQARIAHQLQEISSRELIYEYGVQFLSILALCIAVILPVFLFRRDRRGVEEIIARWFSKIWIEVKLLVIGFSIFYCVNAIHNAAGLLCTCIVLLYFLCLDISHNRSLFRHNIIHSVLKALNSYRRASTFEKRSMRRLLSCIAVVAGVILISTLLFFQIGHWQYGFFRNAAILATLSFFTAGVVGTILWYIIAFRQDLRDWDALMAQISEMYGGNLGAVNHVLPTSNLYDCAMQLNMIRIGIQKAVDEGIKADRTKVELITNVSHDIKTPLTSIISYIELIKKEPDLSPLVMDYVNTISQKAQRLSAIVQDVFEVSKAATGNISLDLEDLDIGKLLHQTFGEMEEMLESAPLTWRVDIPDTPVLVHADGQRLYRVFQNLLRNCTQYSLEGSRVYVQLTAQNGSAVVSIRNISRNEITMDGEDLTARFVRGDQNRTTEGSGLGLSIAKSFTEACGGQFTVHTDGDVFTTVVRFPLAEAVPAVPQLVLETELPPEQDGEKENS